MNCERNWLNQAISLAKPWSSLTYPLSGPLCRVLSMRLTNNLASLTYLWMYKSFTVTSCSVYIMHTMNCVTPWQIYSLQSIWANEMQPNGAELMNFLSGDDTQEFFVAELWCLFILGRITSHNKLALTLIWRPRHRKIRIFFTHNMIV